MITIKFKVKKDLVILATITLLIFPLDHQFGQVKSRPFEIQSSVGSITGVDNIIIKATHKTYEFKMDTSSVDYKTLSQSNQDWIKSIEILKNKELEGETKTVVKIILKKRKFDMLPVDMRIKFR